MSKGQTYCASCSEPLAAAELRETTDVLICGACTRATRAQRRHGWQPVMQWEDGGDGLRLASKAPLPWADRKVVITRITRDGQIRAARTLTGKRAIFAGAADTDLLLAAWPGNWGQDMYVIDDRKAAAAAVVPGRKG